MPAKAPLVEQNGASPECRITQPRIESNAHDLLRNTPYHSLGKVDCRFCNGVLTLRGHVETYFLKQVAQERLLKNLDPSIRIANQLDVA